MAHLYRIDGNHFEPGFRHASSSFSRSHPPPPQSLPPPQALSPPPPKTPPPAVKQNSSHRKKSPKPSFGYSSLHSNNHQKKSQSRVTAAAIGSATCTVFVLLIVGLVLKGWKSCPCRLAKANEVLYSWSSLLIGSETSSSNKDITSVPKIKSWSKTSKTIPTAKQFPAADILAATRNFNEECLIGEGFTGRVYRDAMRSRALSWKARIKIALGVAYALEYIHLTCSPPVAHGNIKPRNILLDAQLMPYLSDSGLTKLSHFSSTARMKNLEALISAKGYAAPELVDPGSDNIRADIYSFGVILLVLLTGQKAFDSSKKQNEQLLVDWATPHLRHPDSLQRITDPRISSYMPPKAISSLGEIILLCIKLVKVQLRAAYPGDEGMPFLPILSGFHAADSNSIFSHPKYIGIRDKMLACF
ncbi:hypothetical protein PR202_ga06780 [Eleusine coracana subsp. coracana]|uniref:Protein kinase domain-containing protein n=1 Tax=Eleusine coracana subsp. coracana TaxID=191504 RepID=A0AAV5BVZ8_ELECO|nr:hypothetical protein PR202_ga06780 [Eleusine coracana subsp. coracana]